MNIRNSIHHHLALGYGVAAFLVLGVGGWAGTTRLSGAVIAPGLLVVDSNVKKIQHPTGGIIGDLPVREGDRVSEGQVVARLDDTQTRTNLAIISSSLDELRARQARGEAERDGAAEIRFPADLLTRTSDPELSRLLAGEAQQFELRRRAREGEKAQLNEQIEQLRKQIEGLAEQEVAKQREAEWIANELKGVRELRSKELVPLNRLTTLERDAVRIQGERGALVSSQAQAKGKISETELKILQIDQNLRSEVTTELAQIRAKVAELNEKRVAAQDQLRRIDLIAPQSGKVFQQTVHTVGGVIQPGETIMQIVPDNDRLMVEAKVPPTEIDKVHLSQDVVLRFTTFNQRTTPELNGEVVRIGADVTQEEKKNESYYSVRIKISDGELARLRGAVPLAGMPIEAFIRTSPRTVLSFLVKPVLDQIERAFRG